MPPIPSYACNNAHMFYGLCSSLEERTALIARLKANGVLAVFHYLSLHKSPFFAAKHDGRELPHADRFADTIVRLPMYFALAPGQVREVCEIVQGFYA